jgi:hypothetical protein
MKEYPNSKVHAIILERGRGSGIIFEEIQNGAIWPFLSTPLAAETVLK